MLDDNMFGVEENDYEVCPYCGSTHVNDKYCPIQHAIKKHRKPWIFGRIAQRLK